MRWAKTLHTYSLSDQLTMKFIERERREERREKDLTHTVLMRRRVKANK